MFWNRRFRRSQRSSADHDLDAARELRAHLDQEAEELREAGASREEAEYAARRAFGNTTSIREEIHAVWTSTILEQLMQDLRYATRVAIKNPGFSIVALMSLALGVGANTAIFTFVNAAYLKPLPYPEASRIVALRQRPLKGTTTTAVHPRSFVRWQDRAQSLEALAIAQAIPVNTEGTDGAEQIPSLWVSRDLFRVFGVQPLLGRGFSSEAGQAAPKSAKAEQAKSF